jgi:very-short-patch-repair endonuclease
LTQKRTAPKYAKNHNRRGTKQSEKTKRKISEALTGIQRSEETKQKVREAKLGTPVSLEQREKISSKLRGIKRSPETIAKMSAAQKKRTITPEHRMCLTEGRGRVGWNVSLETREKISKTLAQKVKDNPEMAIRLNEVGRKGRLVYCSSGKSQIERMIMEELEALHIAYEYEKYLLGYFPDFVIFENIIIEADGNYWHSKSKVQERDAKKDETLTAAGYHVFRLKEDWINNDPESCVEFVIRQAVAIKRVRFQEVV